MWTIYIDYDGIVMTWKTVSLPTAVLDKINEIIENDEIQTGIYRDCMNNLISNGVYYD